MIPKNNSAKTFIFYVLTCINGLLYSQNEAQNWYFGSQAGLSFSTNPPTALTNGMINTNEGCASISNSAGNLLFYTDGIDVYNQAHALMANGTGLTGNGSSTQSAIIVKKPSSSHIYYIFTLDEEAGPDGLSFSEVDMNLAAGMGSVTVKNYTLYTPSCEKITAIRHCNGIDTWVVTHDWGTSDFRTYLITAAGVSLTPVISTSGSNMSGVNAIRSIGQMKVSPNGKKIGLTVYDYQATAPIEVHDFNAATGIVSNALLLGNFQDAYGCEFSPDGTKFYAGLLTNSIMQWNVCAGNNSAIVSSISTFSTDPNDFNGQLQLASNGKIYVAKSSVNVLGLINSPNLSGAACSYTDNGITLGTGLSLIGLPNFINSFFKPTPAPFTYTASCSNYSFTAAPAPTLNAGCGASANPVTNILWNFGDPASGTSNTSTLSNPTHNYPTTGSYTAQLVLYYACSSDTLRATLTATNASPSLSVSGTYTICKGDKRIYTVSGANTYTWHTGVHTTTISLTPTITSVYSVTGSGTNTCKGSKQFTVTVNPCTGIDKANNENASFKIYPNPNNGIFFIETESKVQVELINQLGELIFEGYFEIGKQSIDIHHLSNGLYFLKTISETGSTVVRLVKAE